MTEFEGRKILNAMTENEGFARLAETLKTPEDFVKYAQKADVDVSLDDAKEIMEKANEFHDRDELDESSLEFVNGGLITGALIAIGVLAFVGCIYIAVAYTTMANKRYNYKK